MQRFLMALCVVAAAGTASAQTTPAKTPKEHAIWYANYAFGYNKKECATLVNAEPANDQTGATLADCLSKDGKEVVRYRISSGGTMFDPPKIEMVSTTPK